MLLKVGSKDFSQILHTYLYIVREFSVLTFGESKKCPNGLIVFTSSVILTLDQNVWIEILKVYASYGGSQHQNKAPHHDDLKLY